MFLLFFPFGVLRKKKRKGKKKRTHIPKDKLQNHFRIQTCWGEELRGPGCAAPQDGTCLVCARLSPPKEATEEKQLSGR